MRNKLVKISLLLISLLMLFCFASCGDEETPAPEKVKIEFELGRGSFVDEDFEKGHIQDINAINDGSINKSILRITKASEIANLIAFLLSDATQTITGTSIVIDGGYTL